MTAARKCSGGEAETGGVCGGSKGGEAGVGGSTASEAGTLHTKRHSGDQHDATVMSASCREQRSAPGSLRSVSSLGSGVSSVIAVDTTAPALGATTSTVPSGLVVTLM